MTNTAKTYDRQTATFLAVIAENLPPIPGGVMQGWIENPKALQKALRTALCPPETTSAPREFPTWKTITLGTRKTVKDFLHALTVGGLQIGNRAAQILKKTPPAETETEIELVLVSVADLCFTKATRRDAIYDRAKELGLDLVPAEAGPQLRRAYTDQPMDEWMCMAMEPIAGSDGSLDVFAVGRNDGGQWLGTRYGDPGFVWHPDDRWVFRRRKR
jgi:hypothetical protein